MAKSYIYIYLIILIVLFLVFICTFTNKCNFKYDFSYSSKDINLNKKGMNINDNNMIKSNNSIIDRINNIDKDFLNNPNIDNINNVYFRHSNLTPNINYDNNNIDGYYNIKLNNISSSYYNTDSDIDNSYKPKNLNDLQECQVPTLNTEQCYKSRYYECPIVNGSLIQCTNNYIPKPTQFNADCGNRTFDMTPYPWKISENCYYNKIGFDRTSKNIYS